MGTESWLICVDLRSQMGNEQFFGTLSVLIWSST